MAGHSKWANIQHRKGRQDAARSKLFSKLSKEITVAAKMGEPDPDKNPRLRLAVKEAKSNSVPKDVIDRAINERKGLVVYPASVGDEDTVMMAAIEAGAEDVQSSEDGHEIYCADTDLNDVSNALEAELGESETSKLIWKPGNTTELDLEGMQKVMRLIDALEDDDDVQNVTANFEVSDEVLAQLENA